MNRITHTELIRQLGTSSKGYQYWLGADQYVYQQLPSGEFNGWLCSFPVWESKFHVLLNDRRLVSL